MDFSQVVFVIASAIALGGAVGVVTTRNLFRAALFLVLSFVGVVGLFVLLEAELLAMIQLLVYVGAISILIIFAIMLSQRLMSPEYRAQNEQWLIALVAAVILFGLLLVVLLQVNWPTSSADVPPDTISLLGQALVSPDQFVLVFEVASVLLLVALVGAVIVAREQ
jgi:NADH:ubiquinone oxidoreductase subunit 6 (subunit J)